ncbi:MAG: 3-deoxy-manno-octulosonate cytidylyltransferase [Crocinitomicaceae bacterium]|nr:3-deoxy-manno-octulosonate cytidylyltransferase [Crocinitomicaceae bacterium]
MKVVGIIPARYASSRFPGKPLIDLKGKPMIQRVYEGAKKSSMLDRVIVATDDQRIFDAVQAFGGEVMMTSDKHTTGTDRCGEVANAVEADVVINIQGDEPLVDYRQLDELCKVFEDDQVEIATLGIRNISEEDRMNPNRIKIVLDKNGDAIYFSRSPIPNTDNAKQPAIESFDFCRHIGLYGYRKSTLNELVQLTPTALERVESLEQLRWLYHGYKVRVAETTIETPNIDVPEDIEKVLSAL